MFTPNYQTRFRKDVKLMKKRNMDFETFKVIVNKLLNGEKLDAKYKPHKLSGNYSGFFECHIKPDWLLIYRVDNKVKEITFVRTGSHSDLF